MTENKENKNENSKLDEIEDLISNDNNIHYIGSDYVKEGELEVIFNLNSDNSGSININKVKDIFNKDYLTKSIDFIYPCYLRVIFSGKIIISPPKTEIKSTLNILEEFGEKDSYNFTKQNSNTYQIDHLDFESSEGSYNFSDVLKEIHRNRIINEIESITFWYGGSERHSEKYNNIYLTIKFEDSL